MTMLDRVNRSSLAGNRVPLLLLLGVQVACLINLALEPRLPVVSVGALGLAFLIGATIDRRILLVLVVLSIPASEELYIEAGAVVIRVIDLVLLFATITMVIRWLADKNGRIELLPIFNRPFAAILIMALLSFWGTISYVKSTLELIQIIELFVAALVLYNLIRSPSDLYLALFAFVGYALVDSSWIFYQFLTGQLGGRHVGLFGSLATELSYAIVLTVWFFYTTRRSEVRPIALVCATFMLAALYLTKGRGAMIIAVLMILSASLLFTLRRQKIVHFALVVSVVAITLVGLYSFVSPDMASRYESIVEGGEFRDFRLIAWSVGLKIWQSNPILGAGIGNTATLFEQYAPKPFGIALTALAGVKSPHNEYLNFAMQAGWIGFLVGLFFYGTLFIHSFVNYLRSRGLKAIENFSILLLTWVVGLITWSFANDVLMAGHGMLVMLFAAMIARVYEMRQG